MHDTEDEVAPRAMDGVDWIDVLYRDNLINIDYLARLPLLVRWGRTTRRAIAWPRKLNVSFHQCIANTLLTMAASGDTAYAMMSAAENARAMNRKITTIASIMAIRTKLLYSSSAERIAHTSTRTVMMSVITRNTQTMEFLVIYIAAHFGANSDK